VRAAEAAIRRHVCVLGRLARWHGMRRDDLAIRLGIDVDTQLTWEREIDRQRAGHAPPASLGARPLTCVPAVAARVRHQIAIYGPAIGARTLKPEFPDVSYRDLERIVRGCRGQLVQALRSCVATVCTWTVPGTVWAADYWEADAPIDDQFRWVLDVRDLATGYHIAAVPCEHADADTTIAVFTGLFLTCGAPLVFKTDNGSHFSDDGVREFLDRQGVELLLSPVEMPQYNGACEAGHGRIKVRAEILARREGTPGRWTCNHLEAARTWANALTSRYRPGCAYDRWHARAPIPASERERLRRVVEADCNTRRIEIAEALARGARSSTIAVDAMVRHAIVHALRVLSYLTTRSMPIRQPIPYASN
jgi:transposase InsO family protein